MSSRKNAAGFVEAARTNYERVKFAREANQRWEKAKETLSFRSGGGGESDAKKCENNSKNGGGGIVSKEEEDKERMADERDIAVAARRGCDFGSPSSSASTTIQTRTRERRRKDIFYRAKACERFDDLGGRGQLFACFVVQPAYEENVLCVVDGKGRTMWREEMSERLAERRRTRVDGKLRAGEVVDVGAYQCRITSEGEEDGPFEYSTTDGEEGKTTSSEYGSGESSSSCFSSSEDAAERTKRKPPPPPEMVVELKVNEKTGKLQPPPGYALVAKPEYDEFGIAIEHPGVEYEPQNWWQYFWGYAKVPKPLEVTHKQKKGGQVLSSSSSRRRRSTLNAGEEYRKERDDNTETTIKKEKKEKTKWMRDGWPGKSEGKPRPRPFTDEEVEHARFELLSREAEARQTASEMETRAKLEAAKAAEAALEAAKAALKVKEAALANATLVESYLPSNLSHPEPASIECNNPLLHKATDEH